MNEVRLPEQVYVLKKLIEAGYPLVYLVSWEEKRVTDHMMMLASIVMQPAMNFHIWSVTEGFSDGPLSKGETRNDPLGALDRIINDTDPGIYLLKDFHPFIQQGMEIVRRIRDVSLYCSNTKKVLIFLCPILEVPPELQKDIYVMDYPLPTVDEINVIIEDQLASLAMETGKFFPGIPESQKELLLKTMLGLNKEEVIKCARKILLTRDKINYDDVDYVLEEKRQVLRKTEILEFIPTRQRMRDVGGLKVFKKWIRIRRNGFSDAAREYGLPQPKGVLITGISGCGKSLAIQALANEWKLPLLRLDMGRVFAGFAGNPEESMRRAILTVEAVSPAILWIDEIEMGISVFSDSAESGATNRIFASFLTWMQEKEAPVFIAATANDIDKLPPEMIRKGRFDEVFFVDLPSKKEREQIFKIHLTNRGKTVTDTSVENLAQRANGFTGAEIEQCIINSMYDAFHRGRDITISDIYRAMGNIVPLSVTMKEQITKTKRWADSRAVKAS